MPLISPDFELFDLTNQVTVCLGGSGGVLFKHSRRQ